MPLKRCNVNNKRGWKYGSSGKCYASKSKALKQMKAIHASGYKIKPKTGK